MQQQPRLPLWFLVANLAMITAAFFAGALLGGSPLRELPDPQATALRIVFHEVLDNYIEPPDEHELVEHAIAGMVDSLDEYCEYIPPQKVASYDERNTGHFEGIGVMIATHGDDVVVHFPLADGPAEAAGLLPGDLLRSVDGKQLDTPEARQNVVQLVRGPADTTVRLGIERDGERLEIDVNRGDVQRGCVHWLHFADEARGLGYLHLTDFHPTSHRQLLDALDALRSQRELQGLILDLRYDGGGSLDQCLDIARTFIADGVIATQQRRGKGRDEVYRADPELCRYPDLPLVVLVNEGSASASEVLSGALQDHERALIVGRRTHGKGYVNTVYSWKNFDFKLKLTTGSYRTPKGRNIERNHTTEQQPADKENGGILPDVDVPVEQEQRLAIHDVLIRQNEVPAKYRDAYAEVAQRYELEVPEPPRAETDPQFAAALQALRDKLDRK